MTPLAGTSLSSKYAKPLIVGLGLLGAAALLFLVIYKIATLRLPEVPKIQPRKPLADCTQRVEVGDLWADPLKFRCGRKGDEKGGRLGCLRILKSPGFEKVKTCFDPATIGQAQ